MGKPTQADREATARARTELEVMGEIVDALEPFDCESRLRVLAAAAVLCGVASMDAVRTLLRSV